MVLTTLISLGAVSTTTATPERKKARYYYLEGLRHQAHGRETQAYEYYKKASDIDPTYAEALSAYGTQRLSSTLDTLQSPTEIRRSLAMMRPFVDLYPEEYNESLFYAYVASHIDTLPEAIRVFERIDTLRPDKTVTLVHLADAYMANGETQKALDALSRYEKAEGMSPQVTLKKISYHFAAKDTTGAVEETTRLVEYNPSEPTYLLLKGNMFEVINQPDSMLHYYQLAEASDPRSGAAKMALANYYRNTGDSILYDQKIYEALLAEDYGVEDKTELLADYLNTMFLDKSSTQRGDYLFSVLSEQYPHEPDLIVLSALYSAAKGDLTTAREQIAYAIDLSPTEEKLYSRKILYEIQDNDIDAVIDTYKAAKKHLTPSPDLKMLYANACQFDARYDSALGMYREMISDIDPDMASKDSLSVSDIKNYITYDQLQLLSTIYTNIGDCYYAMKELDKAFASYDNALTLIPSNPLALNNYAYFLVENGGDLDKAAGMSRESLAGDNALNPTYLDTYAWILYKKGDLEEALKNQAAAVEQAALRNNESPELYDHYGDILAETGKTEEAREARERALKLLETELETLDSSSSKGKEKKQKELSEMVSSIKKKLADAKK